MARSLTLPLALLLATGLAAQHTGSITLHFPLDSAEPHEADAAVLRALCDRDDAARIEALTITGHTDLRGSIAYNEDLSRRRAERIRELLLGTCLRHLPVTVNWQGEHSPLAKGTQEPVHATNRRVEVSFTLGGAREATRDPWCIPAIVPLMPAIDKPLETHVTDASRPIDLTMSDGVRVRIPAGAIVDAQGIPVDGPVELNYRSFHEPYEIIASGIPMHVATEEGVGHFETAGMYELTASIDGAPLGLAEGASIELERPEGPPLGEGFTGWRLDDNGAWVPGGSITNTMLPPATIAGSLATEATTLYWQRLWRLERENRPDSALFGARRNSGRYCHMTPCDTTGPQGSWIRQRNRFRHTARVPEIRVVGYKGIYDPDHIIFTIDMKREHDKQFPEWRRLPYPAVWEYAGDASRAMFKRLYGRRHFYQDIELVMRPGQDRGLLRLKENGEWLEIPVSARWNRDTPMRAARWDRAITLHDKALARRRTTFDREVGKAVARFQREHADMPRTAWKHARRAMNAGERAMEPDTFYVHADTRRPVEWSRRWEEQQRSLGAVQTTFGLQGFGVYNIDRIMKMRDQMNVLAAAIGPSGRPFPWVHGFAVLRNENSVITYWGGGTGRGDNFLVSPGNMRSLFLVDADGNIARADVAPLNSRDSRVVLNVTPLGEPKSIGELRAEVR